MLCVDPHPFPVLWAVQRRIATLRSIAAEQQHSAALRSSAAALQRRCSEQCSTVTPRSDTAALRSIAKTLPRRAAGETRCTATQQSVTAEQRLGAYVQVLSSLQDEQVIIVAGETGCGKTTQVPQYILEAEAAAGRPCRILCSQPRRISAVSVASRVAAERGEAVGASVGYAIRLESVACPNTSLMFVTTGAAMAGS